MHPLYWMHSGLPGAGYDVKFVLLAGRQTRFGFEQSIDEGPPLALDA
jgi:hypothetical protein